MRSLTTDELQTRQDEAFQELFNLRRDPYERATITSNTYHDWQLDRVFLMVPAQAYVGRFLETFREFPFPWNHPRPGHAPGGHLAHGHRGKFGKEAGHILFAAPVGAFHSVFEVNIGVVAAAHGDVAKGGLHTALGGGTVGAAGRDQAQNGHLMTVHGSFDSHPFAC